MVISVDVPESIVREADDRGIAVEALVRERLDVSPDFASRPGMMRFGSGSKTPSEAAADIRKLRVGQTLGGEITIKQLIDESRP
jgi:hypothetical protein